MYHIINETDDQYEVLVYRKNKNRYYDKYNYVMFEHHDKWLPDTPHEAKGSGKFIVFKNHLRFARKLATFNLETFGPGNH